MLDAQPAPDARARPLRPAVPIAPPAEPARPVAGDALFTAARTLLPVLEAGKPLEAATLRDAMTGAFGASDSSGAWVWKDAYEAAEAAVVLFLRRYGRGMRRNAGAGRDGPHRMLAMLEAVAALEPSHTRRSEEQVRLQQFSTPLPLAYAALQAAAIRPGDILLEPSAGTGMLAVMAQCALGDRAAGALHLNEYARIRASLLARLFPEAVVTAFNAETIADRLHDVRPTVVLMNPPFSATPGVDRITRDADLRHVRSAASMLPPGGRLVTITSAHCAPGEAVGRLDPPARCIFTMAIDGRAYARRGTGFDTRLTVLERGAGPAVELDGAARAANAAELLDAVIARVPKRRPIAPAPIPTGPARDLFGKPVAPKPAKREPKHASTPETRQAHDWGPVTELAVETGPVDPSDTSAGSAAEPGPYASWRPAVVRLPGAVEHPTPLVQSAAMAAVPHPVPAWRPMLPDRVVTDGLLSDAQLESVVLAGEAHSRHLAAEYRIGSQWETVHRCQEDGDEGDEIDTSFVTQDGETLSEPVRFRRGWMLGDGTGCGKGRQVAAIILDNRLRGRKRALWLSQSDKLLEDARRDWTALGGLESDVIPLGNFRQGMEIPLDAGILFATYATLRSPSRQGKPSRLDQIVEWLAGSLDEEDRHAFDGVIVFDEAHAMANAAGSKSERGETKPSQQGRAGLRLQNALPDARIAYVSATGATTLPGLAYAGRLGLWAAGETPFEKRTDFVSAMEAGGVAAMEVVARDLKALGLYQARALAYDGIEVDILEHPLTPEQRRIYDAYADAFKVIHANIEEALKATGIVQGEDTLNKNAKAAALSAFEGTKQRFFGHLLTGMKCPSTIRSIEADLAAGRSSVVQLVSTGEALMERRIADVPASEWDDLNIDLTPRDAILSYLMHAFPVQLQEPFTDDGGNLLSRPARDADGNPVISKEAEDRRDALIEKLAALLPVPTALDQIVQHFGHEAVAEVTGRSRRVLRITDAKGERLALRSRPASANLAETAAFMDGEKRILVFSMAGGTGRSYHADLSCGNTERRIHYLLEPGWRADQAIQGLGRTHRTHQASAPLFRPVTTDVKGERQLHRHHRHEGWTAWAPLHVASGIQPDRHGRQRRGAVPRERQSGERLRPGGAQAVLRRALEGKHRRLDPGALREGHRAEAHLGGQSQGRPAAHAPVPQPAIGAAHRRAEPALRRTGGAHRVQYRAGDRGRQLRGRRRDDDRRLPRHRRPGDPLRASRHRSRHRADRDRPPRQAGATDGGIGAGDRHTRSRSEREAPPRGQRPLQARRNRPAGRVAHARRRRGEGARAAHQARHRRDHGEGRARRLQLAPRRRGRVAPRLGRRDRRAAVPPGVALLARHRAAAAGLGPPARGEHAGQAAHVG